MIHIYYSSDASDVYSSNLRDDAAAAFEASGFQAVAVPYTSGNTIAAGRSICGIDGGSLFAAGACPTAATSWRRQAGVTAMRSPPS